MYTDPLTPMHLSTTLSAHSECVEYVWVPKNISQVKKACDKRFFSDDIW